MFRYKTVFKVHELISEHFEVGISLQSGSKFKVQDCYCSFIRVVDPSERDVSEWLEVSYYTKHKNDKEAKEKIEKCLNLLVFIIAIPLESTYIGREEVATIFEKIPSKYNSKVMKIQEIDTKINKFKGSKELFFEILALNRKGTQYSYMDNFEQEAYLYFFKVIENISKDYFGKEGNRKLKPDFKKVKRVITSIIGKDFNIIYSDNKADEIAGQLSKYLISLASDDIYSKISFLCNQKNVKIDYNLLGKAVSLRNKIAHDSYIDMNEHSKEYGFIMNLSREIVAKKYFNRKYKNMWIKSRVSIPGAIFYEDDK